MAAVARLVEPQLRCEVQSRALPANRRSGGAAVVMGGQYGAVGCGHRIRDSPLLSEGMDGSPRASVTAWAIRCFEIWLDLEQIQDPELDALADHIWQWLSVDETTFQDWHDNPPALVEVGLGGELPRTGALTGRQRALLVGAITNVTELAYYSLFGAFDGQAHAEFADGLGQLLDTHQVAPPARSSFGVPEDVVLDHSWGPIPAELVAQWRKVAPGEPRRPHVSGRTLQSIEVLSRVPPDGLALDQPAVIDGRYIAHWEWTRFEIRRSRWRGPVMCELVAVEGVAASPLQVLGEELPDDWRHHPGLRFDVRIHATPIEEGRFGHRGTIRWKLAVRDWLHVAKHD